MPRAPAPLRAPSPSSPPSSSSSPSRRPAGSSTGDTGYFWFFDPANVELMTKVIDGRAVNSRFWLFYGALSSVEYTLTVADTQTGAVKEYRNPSGHLGSFADTDAF